MKPRLTPERWRRVEPLLDRLLQAPLEERAALAAALSGGDDALRGELVALAEAASQENAIVDGAAERCVEALLAEDAPGELEGRALGPWRVGRELGRGGMGVVYLAERAHGEFEQRSALKLLRRGVDTDEVLARFRRERQILARLEHPHIARLLDGGAAPDGRPYLAMEYVEGQPITAWCDERRLPVADRLRLFLSVCAAVDHAHRRLVVHRDLKPSNILVTPAGVVKLLDFGIAKLLGAEEEQDVTRGGLRVMTPRYAAPEQVRGEAVTTATDTYALGLLLYELLCGRGPYRLADDGDAALERAVLAQDPEPPSLALRRREGPDDRRAEQAAQRRASSTARLERQLAGDLDAIALTALRKEPERRYPSAEALARDVERHLGGFPVRARVPTAGYRVRRFLGRHRTAALAALVIALSLLAGLGTTWWQARARAREARKAETVTRFLVSLFAVSDPSRSRGEAVTARELLDEGARRIEGELAGEPALQADLLATLSDVYAGLALFDRSLALADKSLVASRRAYGDAHPATALALRMRGRGLHGNGDYAQAETALREALKLHREALGPRHLEVAEDLEELATTRLARGELDEAERLVREALEIRRSLAGAGSPGLAIALNNLALMLKQKGRFAEAEPLYREALEIRRLTLGADHPQTAQTLENLAEALRQLGRLTEAEAVSREALATTRKLYGEDNANTTRATNNLAVMLQSLAQYDEAEPLFRSVLAYWRKAQGERHPNALVTQHNLATVLRERGADAEAEALLEQFIAAWPQAVGPKHSFNAVSRVHLAALERERGEYGRAEALLAEALAIQRASLGEQHPDVAAVLHQTGLLELERGMPEPAEDTLRRALAVRERALGQEHRLTAQTRVALGSALRAQKRLAEAAELQQPALEACRAAYPPRHPELAWAALELGRTLALLGRAGPAEERFREALAIRRASLGERHWKTAEAALELARRLAANGDAAQARALAESALAALLASRGPLHPLTRAAQETLSGLPAPAAGA